MSKPPPKGTLVAVYGRSASTGWSVSDQIALCCLFAESHEWVVVEVYKDEARSGRLPGNGLSQMMTAAAAGRFEVLLIRDLSRISRDPALVQNMLNILGEAGVSVGVVPDPPTLCDSCAAALSGGGEA